MAVTIDEIELALITKLQGVLGGGYTYYKEQMDQFPGNAETFTVIFETGQSSVRSPNDELQFTLVINADNYTSGKSDSMNVYRVLHGLFDIFSGDLARKGQGGFWLCEPPFRFASDVQQLMYSNIWVIRCRTWAETRL